MKKAINKSLTSWKKVGINLVPVNTAILFFLIKKKEGTLHMCIEYRALNISTIINAYPIPCIEDIPNFLRDSVIFSEINLAQGYHKAQIAKGHKHRPAFLIHFEYHVVPLRLFNSP